MKNFAPVMLLVGTMLASSASLAVTQQQMQPWIDIASQVLTATGKMPASTPAPESAPQGSTTSSSTPASSTGSTTDRVLQAAQVLGGLTQASASGNLNADTINQAIRDTLTLSSDRASARMTSADVMNSKLSDKTLMALTALRLMGYGPKIDGLQSALTTGGTQAIQQAKPLFTQAIKNMSIVDAYKIVTGGQDAATQYFRAQTEAQMRDQFRQLLQGKLQNTGYGTYYQMLQGATLFLPAKKRTKLDFETALVNKAVDRYYSAMAQEEAKIRKDPVGQGSKLISTVFAAKSLTGK